jgi:hypothetical protein
MRLGFKGRTIAGVMRCFGMQRSAEAVSAMVLLTLAGWPAIAASPSGCPEIPGQKLVYVDVFDGPPEQLADLVPDQHVDRARKRAWNIWQLKAGPEGLFVMCGYGKALAGPYSQRETIRLPDSTRLCRADFRSGPGQSALTLMGFLCR